jgi:hypothetical protein
MLPAYITPSVPALPPVVVALQVRAEKDKLQLIVGNNQPAVKLWKVPRGTRKIVAEGGRISIRASKEEACMIFEARGDANILGYFTATLTSEDEFHVLPKEGFLLASYTPITLHLRMPNGSLPNMSTHIGSRAISLPVQ